VAKRLIEVCDLPKSLWCKKTKILQLPSLLVSQWKALLEENSLLELANTKADKGFEGGASQEDCDKHIAWRYNGSCGRVVLSLLDPNQKLSVVSDAYASIFAGGSVFLADLPCGSGAASISILTTIAQLRAEKVLPRLPLTVIIVGADISSPACKYFSNQLDNLSVYLSEQAILVKHTTVPWDILSKFNTADLIRELTLHSQDCTSRLLVISNFSGFLDHENNFKNAESQLDDLFVHSRASTSMAIWIEPQSRKAKRLWSSITNWFYRLFLKNKNNGLKGELKVYAEDDAAFQHPIKAGSFPVRLSVRRFELPL